MLPSKRPYLLIAFCALILCSSFSAAQYFGQNKVRYEDYDFRVLKTPHFDIYYYERESRAVDDVGRMAERWYARLSKIFHWQLSSRQPVIIYANSADFRSTTVIPGEIGLATGGVTELLQRRVVLPLAGPLAETDHVLGHELVHAFQYDIGGRSVMGMNSRLEGLPLWFIEGMAEYLSLGPVDANTAMWMRDAVLRNEVPKIKDLDNPKYFPYRYGQALWAYLAGQYRDEAVGKMFRAALSRRGSAESAIESVSGKSVKQLSADWQNALRAQYGPVLEATTPAKKTGRVIVHRRDIGGEINVSPALSPDGRYLMFLSERGLFSIDLYLADARTGEVKRKITSTATDPHFNALEFTSSAGAWSADSTQFAYPHVEGSKPYIAIYDLAKDDTVRDIKLGTLGEITGVTWSPDAKQIAFAAIQGGLTDLYTIDVASSTIHRLTHDEFGYLPPAWSPDGRSLVFATDRFTSNPREDAYGAFRLGRLDLATGAISEVKTFNGGSSIDPQWGSDGALYFVSDRNGIPNVYRIGATGEIAQITDVQTGVSGITADSPALSVARDRLAFSAFTDGGYEIVTMTNLERAGTPQLSPARVAGKDAAALPPQMRTSEVAGLLSQPTVGLTSSQDFSSHPYNAGLTLDYVAPPSVAAATTGFGTLVGGGTALHFSDVLNHHTLVTEFQTFAAGDASNILRNLNVSATYLNQTGRWNWGFTGGQLPYVSSGFQTGLANINGQTVGVQQQLRIWQIDRNVAGIFQYPFSRAQRVEFQAGYDNISFAGEVVNDVFDPVTGALLAEQKKDLPTGSALHMATGSTALVYDTSVFGGTSPIMGQRYRFEAGVEGGSLNFYTLLGDFRKYVHIARPLSLAGRALTYGRYGGDAGSQRLQPLYVGYDSFVRGYDPNSISVSECGPSLQTTGACPVFDRLIGSRIAVANAEARLELLGPIGLFRTAKVPPIEIAPFFDAGRAWSAVEPANVNRKWVSSYGSSLRVNLLGFAVAQITLAHPNDRPQKNWVWEFSFLPGW